MCYNSQKFPIFNIQTMKVHNVHLKLLIDLDVIEHVKDIYVKLKIKKNLQQTFTLGEYRFLWHARAELRLSALSAIQYACISRDEYPRCLLIFLYIWAFSMWWPSSIVLSADRGASTREYLNAIRAWPCLKIDIKLNQ